MGRIQLLGRPQPEAGSQFSQTANTRISAIEVTKTGIVNPSVAKAEAR